jgi:hypothetical protein
MGDFTTIENHWITLADGTRLAARIWIPDGAEADPVPAVFEFLPYRKRDGTAPRDESTYPYFAQNRIAGVRVDIRGSGESSGVIDGEYTELELANACELIDWIAAQPWSNGNVGMMGISWGGFNCLQVAALRPKPLKAVISISSTVDRYNDDVHYKNGCHLGANLGWAGVMQAYQSRSPDPELVGEAWRAMWMERLENNPNFALEWISHQRRDAFWRHGSICEDFAAVDIPALVIAGWADGYRNTPIKAIEGLGPKAKAIIGPWIHKYPHFAWPKPRMDFLGEAVRWWKRWLADAQNGAEDLPQLRAFRAEATLPPAPRREHEDGVWLAIEQWTPPANRPFHVDAAGCLTSGSPVQDAPRPTYLRSPLSTGTMAGEWFTLSPGADLAGDQRADDAGSLTFETVPFDEAFDILGRPELTLTLACPGDWSNICARLVDVHPDGTASRIGFGVLNLAHRDSSAAPALMPEGSVPITMVLDACGYRLRPGHKLRLALSTSYWPTVLPSPRDPGVTINTASIHLGLPYPENAQPVDVPAPSDPNPLPEYISHSAGSDGYRVSKDRVTGCTTHIVESDTGHVEHPGTGMTSRTTERATWDIEDGDPTSLTGRIEFLCETSRPGWSTRTTSHVALSCTEDEWLLSGQVTAYENDTEMFNRPYEHRIPRDYT